MFALQQIIYSFLASILNVLYVRLNNGAFQQYSLYKRMRLTSKVNVTKCFSEKYKRMRLITRLYGIATFESYKICQLIICYQIFIYVKSYV